MQRLEVSCAVRHICMSLGAKGLNNAAYIILVLVFYVEGIKICLLKEGFITLAQILAFH